MIFEFLWRLLPDRCEAGDCLRKGVRGNENRMKLNNWPHSMMLCDDCTYRALKTQLRPVKR